MGTRLRMLVSNDEKLSERVEEYAKYLTISGWRYEKALRDINKGAQKCRNKIIHQPRKKKTNKIAWVTNFDPRAPSKSAIIKKNMHLLHANPDNKTIFPPKRIISAERRLKNLGEMYKPTIPKRFIQHGPKEAPGFFKCVKKCDTCNHATNTTMLTSPWDNRTWRIREHLTCTTPNVVYVLRCSLHPDEWYVGSTVDLKRRWANHKSDTNLGKVNKCMVASHVRGNAHPKDKNLPFLSICPIESVREEDKLLQRELFWQANLGTLTIGLNRRKDLNAVIKRRVHYQNKDIS